MIDWPASAELDQAGNHMHAALALVAAMTAGELRWCTGKRRAPAASVASRSAGPYRARMAAGGFASHRCQ